MESLKKTPDGKRRRSELEKILAKNAHYKKLDIDNKKEPDSLSNRLKRKTKKPARYCEPGQIAKKAKVKSSVIATDNHIEQDHEDSLHTEMEVDSSKNESAEHTEVKISLAKFALERRLLFFMSSI